MSLNEAETIRGLSILVNNCAVQISGLALILETGGNVELGQGKTTLAAVELAKDAIDLALPVLRKLARTPRKGGAK